MDATGCCGVVLREPSPFSLGGNESCSHCRLRVQWVFYGHGTNWHPVYCPTLALAIVLCFSGLYSLRYRLATWQAFTLVKLYDCIAICTLFVEWFLPLPGFLADRWLHFVPFQSPTMSMAYMYFMVRYCSHMVLGSDDVPRVVAL